MKISCFPTIVKTHCRKLCKNNFQDGLGYDKDHGPARKEKIFFQNWKLGGEGKGEKNMFEG